MGARYYIDYRNSRPNYLEAFWNLVNWDFVNETWPDPAGTTVGSNNLTVDQTPAREPLRAFLYLNATKPKQIDTRIHKKL